MFQMPGHESVGSGETVKDASERTAYYRRLFFRMVALTLLFSVLPLILVGWIIHNHYTRFAEERMMDFFRTQSAHHKKVIELFLEQRISTLMTVAGTSTKEQLADLAHLQSVFDTINQKDRSYTDLGVIDEGGRHLAYVGPYSLLDKNYAAEPWFKAVMNHGVHVSDMFMGFRKSPHFIIAVTRNQNGHKWILRTTIDTEVFRSLVESARLGATGEVILLNKNGRFQTTPRFSGSLMGLSPYPVGEYHTDTRVAEWQNQSDGSEGSPKQIMAQTWLKEPQWLLIVKQDYDEALDSVNHANRVTLGFLYAAALIIICVTVLISWRTIGVIRRKDDQWDQLNKQYMQAAKLASIGELSAGVAHEINNPLAIILTEKQILQDMEKACPHPDEEFMRQFNDSMNQVDIQVKRCRRITQNLLRFSRRTQSVIEPVELNGFIAEVVDLMAREASTGGVTFHTEFDPGIQPVMSDPSQLQQVFLNLITNAIDAHDSKPYGDIRIGTRFDKKNSRIDIWVQDTGSGIDQKVADKIFDPFFTTKPQGKGTGLGLSICHSIIKRLGGDIRVSSVLGQGTRFDISLPLVSPET